MAPCGGSCCWQRSSLSCPPRRHVGGPSPAPCGTRAVPVLPGSRTAAGPTLSVSSQLDVRRYAASGDRAYELGTRTAGTQGFHPRRDGRHLHGADQAARRHLVRRQRPVDRPGHTFTRLRLRAHGPTADAGRAEPHGLRAHARPAAEIDSPCAGAGREREPERRRPLRADERLPVGPPSPTRPRSTCPTRRRSTAAARPTDTGPRRRQRVAHDWAAIVGATGLVPASEQPDFRGRRTRSSARSALIPCSGATTPRTARARAAS